LAAAPGTLLAATGRDVKFPAGGAAVATRRARRSPPKVVIAERDALVDAAVNRARAIGLSTGENVRPGVVLGGVVVVSGGGVVFHA